MTGRLGSLATTKVVQLITAPSGVNAGLAALTLPGAVAGELSAAQVVSQNVAAEVAEKAMAVQYPTVSVYCEKLINNQSEKFRSFSGSIQMAMELRYSQDRLDGLQDAMATYADALLQVLEASQGDWGNGMYYGGAYQASYGPVKHGGRNFLQTAKITFEIGVSIN